MTEEILSEGETATVEVSEPRRKCTTQPVLTAALKLRYLSNLTPTDQSTAESAFLTTENPEKTGINIANTSSLGKFHLTIMSVSLSLGRANGRLLLYYAFIEQVYCYIFHRIMSLNFP